MKTTYCMICMLSIALVTGCGYKNKGSEKANDVSVLPEHYSVKTERVIVDCDVEVAEEFRNQKVPELKVTGFFYPNFQEIEDIYLNGKEVQSEHVYGNGKWSEIEERDYLMEDGSKLSSGSVFIYAGSMAGDYTRVGFLNEENRKRFSEDNLGFATRKAAIDAVKKELLRLEYPVEEMEFHAYAATAEQLFALQERNLTDGIYGMDKKREWSQTDDAYMVWARQIYENMPILDETKSMGGKLLNDVPNSMVIQAIYTARGIDFVKASNVYLYEFEKTGKELALKDINEIVETVTGKYANLLTESLFEVKVIRLYQRVSVKEPQGYSVEPVWYFEVSEDGQDSKAMIVNAVNGEEIILNEYM